MKKILLLLPALLFLACSQTDHPAAIRQKLLGRWEVAWEITPTDSINYLNNPARPCFYALLPYDYNSGFQLWENGRYDLIWCAKNKGQFVDGWEFKNDQLHFPWPDQKEVVFSLENLSEESLDLISHDTIRYHLIRLH